MRSLAQLVVTRHGFDSVAWNYVKAHVGHPWNEGADALAKYAAVHNKGNDESHCWEHWLHNESKQTALQWLWYVEMMVVADPRVPLLRNEQMICQVDGLNSHTQQTQLPTQMSSSPSTPPVNAFNFKIATVNVLTLANESKNASSISRQFVLMQQFDAANCMVVGVQETRHQHVTGTNNEYYHIYNHRATQTSQDPLLEMYFHHRQSSSLWKTKGRSTCFLEQHHCHPAEERYWTTYCLLW